jgi:hypothetical protein
MSDNLPAIGVITAPAIRYEESIHDEVLYSMLKSRIKSGIAGNTIVSPYIVIRPKQLKITNVVHAERVMLLCFSKPVIVLSTSTIFCGYLKILEVEEYADRSHSVKKLEPPLCRCLFVSSKDTLLYSEFKFMKLVLQ